MATGASLLRGLRGPISHQITPGYFRNNRKDILPARISGTQVSRIPSDLEGGQHNEAAELCLSLPSLTAEVGQALTNDDLGAFERIASATVHDSWTNSLPFARQRPMTEAVSPHLASGRRIARKAPSRMPRQLPNWRGIGSDRAWRRRVGPMEPTDRNRRATRGKEVRSSGATAGIIVCCTPLTANRKFVRILVRKLK